MDKTLVKKWGFFILKRLVIYSLLLAAVPVVMGYIFMEKLLLPEVKSSARSGNTTIYSGNIPLDCFLHLPQPGKPVILYSHGNGETLESIKPLLRKFIAQGYGVAAYDYAGYGFSAGKASEKQVYCDAESVYTFLTKEKSFAPQDIIVMGFSVGSGASCYLAERHPNIKALVLIAPFASAIEVMLPFALPGNRFDNKKRLERSTVPILIFHGTEDTIIPFRNSEKLYNSAVGRKCFIPVKGAEHNNIFDFAGTKFYQVLKEFISK